MGWYCCRTGGGIYIHFQKGKCPAKCPHSTMHPTDQAGLESPIIGIHIAIKVVDSI